MIHQTYLPITQRQTNQQQPFINCSRLLICNKSLNSQLSILALNMRQTDIAAVLPTILAPDQSPEQRVIAIGKNLAVGDSALLAYCSAAQGQKTARHLFVPFCVSKDRVEPAQHAFDVVMRRLSPVRMPPYFLVRQSTPLTSIAVRAQIDNH